MEPTLKTPTYRTIWAVAVAAGLILTTPAAVASGAMPVEQQNALVEKYCAVCHTDAVRNGGLSLEHFDAARPDPGVAAMIVSKLKANAMGASGQPLPDRAAQDALLSALSAASVGANRWTVNQAPGPAARAQITTASIVQEVPSTHEKAVSPDLYRLIVTCNSDTHEGEMQLAWSPAVPENGRVLSASVDGNAAFTYKVEGSEKMGNGQDGTSGPGAAILAAVPLPARTLTISNLFPDETVVFPFDGLTQTVRQTLSTCFTGIGSGR